jgi:hypothetical protein
MNSYMKKLLLVFLLTLGNSVYGQVLSIDRLSEQDTIKRSFRIFTALSFSNEKQKKALLDFTNKTELYYFTKRDYLVGLLAQVDVALNGKTINENNGFFQLRFRDNDTRKISPDFFTQYQWNGIQGMEYRFLLGANARFKFFEKKKSDLFAGIGIFQESERWNPTLTAYAFSVDSLSVINRNMLRLNTTAKFALLFGKNTELTGTTFVQFPLNSNFNSPRWFLDMNLNFNFSKHLSFSIHYDHNLDAFRPLPIDTYFYATTMGIQLRW